MSATLSTLPEWAAPVLVAFKVKHGRNWRTTLDDLYYSGQDACVRLDGFPEAGSVLRQIRNHPDRDTLLNLAKTL